MLLKRARLVHSRKLMAYIFGSNEFQRRIPTMRLLCTCSERSRPLQDNEHRLCASLRMHARAPHRSAHCTVLFSHPFSAKLVFYSLFFIGSISA